MKYLLMISVFVLFVSLSPSLLSAELDTQLDLLKPLLDKEWTGGYVGPESADFKFTLRFEQILDGQAVRYSREVPDADFSGLTHFYWNPYRQKVCFLSLNNRGIAGEVIVTSEDGNIVLLGQSFRPDQQPTDFRTTWEIDPDGTLRDTFERLENGKWVQGHVQEFTEE